MSSMNVKSVRCLFPAPQDVADVTSSETSRASIDDCNSDDSWTDHLHIAFDNNSDKLPSSTVSDLSTADDSACSRAEDNASSKADESASSRADDSAYETDGARKSNRVRITEVVESISKYDLKEVKTEAVPVIPISEYLPPAIPPFPSHGYSPILFPGMYSHYTSHPSCPSFYYPYMMPSVLPVQATNTTTSFPMQTVSPVPETNPKPTVMISPPDSLSSSGVSSTCSISPRSSPGASDGVSEAPASSRGRRTCYTQRQVRAMENLFLETRYPDYEVFEKMSAELGIPVKKIKVWFQNRRARNKNRSFDQVSYKTTLPAFMPYGYMPTGAMTSHPFPFPAPPSLSLLPGAPYPTMYPSTLY